jgi:hypothetical protein
VKSTTSTPDLPKVRPLFSDEIVVFNWSCLVDLFIHPAKIAIIEAFHWIGQPMSPSELEKILDSKWDLETLAYHTKFLRDGAILESRGNRAVRGSRETYYFFTQSASLAMETGAAAGPKD